MFDRRISVYRAVGWADRISGWRPNRVLPRDSGKPQGSPLLAVGERLPGCFLHPVVGDRSLRSDDRQLRHSRRYRARSRPWFRPDAVRRLRSSKQERRPGSKDRCSGVAVVCRVRVHSVTGCVLSGAALHVS